MFYIVALMVLILDQLSKSFVQTNMQLGQTIQLFPNVFDITYVQNTGAAFGIFSGKQMLLTIVCSAMIIALIVYVEIQDKKIPKLEIVSIALIVSGGLGNLITRTMYGYVVDFFNFYFWPVFNVADIAICVGCGLLVLSVLILQPIEENRLRG